MQMQENRECDTNHLPTDDFVQYAAQSDHGKQAPQHASLLDITQSQMGGEQRVKKKGQ
jgi:hypothetical protein